MVIQVGEMPFVQRSFPDMNARRVHQFDMRL